MKIRKYEKLVISICMLLVVNFALVTATYAWYAGTDPTILEALNLTMDDKGDLKVDIVLESGERMDMSQVDGSGASIDLALSKLINIEENKLGPGAFGEVHIFISSRSATYTSYDIKIIPNCDLIEDGDEDALALAKEHIRFYAAKTDAGYEQLIPYTEVVSGINLMPESETEDETGEEIQNEDKQEEVITAPENAEYENIEEINDEDVVAMAISMEEGGELMDNLQDETEVVDEPQNVDESQNVDNSRNVENTKEPEPLIQTKASPTVTAEGITGAIASGEETEIVLYWYWPYEYDDVPDKTQISAQNEREYDLNDTVIGNYIQAIGFTFVVEGNTDEE